MSTGTSSHFGHLLQVSKTSLWSLVLYIFFHDFIHVYSPEQGQTALSGQSFDVNRNFLSLHSFVASFKTMSLKVWFYTFFFHDLIHVYSPGTGAGSPPGDKILMSTERLYYFIHLLQVSKKSLWSLILYNFFHDLIHVYSPGAGGIQPPGGKVLMSTGTSYHFSHLLLVSIHCFTFFSYKSVRDQIWPCRKISQDQPSIIIWTNLVVCKHPMLHNKFQGPHLLIPEKKTF